MHLYNIPTVLSLLYFSFYLSFQFVSILGHSLLFSACSHLSTFRCKGSTARKHGKFVFGLWIEFHHSSNGWQKYRIRYYDMYDKYFEESDSSKRSETFKEFYTSKKEALEVATKIYMLNKAA